LKQKQKIMKSIIVALALFLGIVCMSHAQTTLIEWQTNWPAGGTNILYTSQQNLPATSAWYTGTKANLQGISNGTSTNLVAANFSGSSSLTWWTYFGPTSDYSPTNTATPNPPIQLSPGQTIRVTLNFFVMGSAPQNSSRSMKFGLFYSGTNANVTGSGNAKQLGLTGYAQFLNFGTTFGIAPLQTTAATNLVSASAVFASTADYGQIGSNGGGTTNDPAFVDTTNYTFVFSVTENSPTNVSITSTFSGSTLTNGMITQTVTDTNYCCTNFDTFTLREHDGAITTATNFTITSFKVETLTASVTPISLTSSLSGSTLTLTWPSTGWTLQSQTNGLSTGLYTNWVDFPGSSTVTQENITIDPTIGTEFFRLRQ
jgi:hypothetical protein